MNARWFGPLLLVGMVVFGVWAYPRLPEQIPSHWNVRGEVDDWSGRWAVFLPVLIAAGMWLLLPLLRRIDPRRQNYARFESTFWVVLTLLTLFMAVLQIAIVGAALEWPIAGDQLILPAVGLLFIGLGNYLPRIRSNWWIGIRTPWTLSSDTVWRATHRLGGFTFVAGGLVLLGALWVPPEGRPWLLSIALAVAAGVPAIYSYIAYRREQKAAGD